MTIIIVFVLIAFLSLSNSKTSFMHNLPLGEYRLVYEKLYPCQSSNIMQCNMYLNKKTLSINELIGNVTLLLPLDDTHILDANMASWDTIGGWKPNSMVYTTKNACSNWKKVLGNVWTTMTKALNLPNSSCPIPAGTYYISRGVDVKELEDLNFPKVYFYGKYKLTVKLKNSENKVLGCSVMEMSCIRPWEKQI